MTVHMKLVSSPDKVGIEGEIRAMCMLPYFPKYLFGEFGTLCDFSYFLDYKHSITSLEVYRKIS